MVADNTIGLHHVEFHTYTYGFTLSATRTTPHFSQWLLDSHQCRLIVSSALNTKPEIEKDVNKDHYDILTTLLADETSRSFMVDRKTVFNLALTVNCVQSVLDRNPDVQVIFYKTVFCSLQIRIVTVKDSVKLLF
jgi:hypothetical protein